MVIGTKVEVKIAKIFILVYIVEPIYFLNFLSIVELYKKFF